jgi:hypothetical protein
MIGYSISIDNYINPEVQGNILNQILENKICYCGHSESEHEFSKCFGLDNYDSFWKACDCRKLVIQNLVINLTVNKD